MDSSLLIAAGASFIAPTRWLSVPELTGHREVVREALVYIIKTLDRQVASGVDVPAEFCSRIRAYLRRQVDRDNQLVEHSVCLSTCAI